MALAVVHDRQLCRDLRHRLHVNRSLNHDVTSCINRIAPLKLQVACDKLTLRLLSRLRLQHGSSEVAKAACVAETAAAVHKKHRDLVLGQVYEATAIPQCLSRSCSPEPKQPLWQSSYGSPGNLDEVSQPAVTNYSNSLQPLSGFKSLHLPWSKHIDGRLQRSLSGGQNQPSCQATTMLPSLAVEAAVSVPMENRYTELYEDCCCTMITIEQLPGQWSVQVGFLQPCSNCVPQSVHHARNCEAADY